MLLSLPTISRRTPRFTSLPSLAGRFLAPARLTMVVCWSTINLGVSMASTLISTFMLWITTKSWTRLTRSTMLISTKVVLVNFSTTCNSLVINPVYQIFNIKDHINTIKCTFAVIYIEFLLFHPFPIFHCSI